MRIGLSSIVGDGFGYGTFVFGEVQSGGGGSCPPAGTTNGYTASITYPIANGGAFLLSGPSDDTPYPTENAVFTIKNDGSCGTYIDYSTASSVTYKPYGEVFWTTSVFISSVDVEIPYSGSGNYYTAGTTYEAWAHNGSGGSFLTSNTLYIPAGTPTGYASSYQTEVPTSSGNNYDNGKYSDYRWDGSGYFYEVPNLGSYYPNGTAITSYTGTTEVPMFSGNYYNNGLVVNYTWNGSGGYNSSNASDYYTNGSYNGLEGLRSVNGEDNYVEVPSGSGNTYAASYYGFAYRWDGYGGYYMDYSATWYKPYGTYIGNFDGYDFYWDGNGSYYSV